MESSYPVLQIMLIARNTKIEIILTFMRLYYYGDQYYDAMPMNLQVHNEF